MTDASGQEPAPVERVNAFLSGPLFLWKALGVVTDGTFLFLTWMTALTCVCLVGLNAWSLQLYYGLGATAMTDQVSWGIYIGNFSYSVGLTAAAVTMVIPAFVYHDHDMHEVVIVGQVLAIAAIVMALAFINVDLGRFDRSWHMVPGLGDFHWPISMLTWDELVLFGYMVINIFLVTYVIYMKYLGREPRRWLYLPFVFLSIFWAFSVHTIGAFLYCGLGSRPFWNTAIVLPRVVDGAFASGLALVVLALHAVRSLTKFHVGDRSINMLLGFLRVLVPLNLFLLAGEVFVEFYTGGEHEISTIYQYFGLHGHHALVPFVWTSLVADVLSVVLFATSTTKNMGRIVLACMCTLLGTWIEKAVVFVISAFVPSTLNQMLEYLPNHLEWKVSAGIVALGLIVFTLGVKVAVAAFTGGLQRREV